MTISEDAAVLAVSAFLLLDGDGVRAPGGAEPGSPSDVTAAEQRKNSAVALDPPVIPVPERAPAPAAAGGAGTKATIRARLVDERGGAISGVRATLKGTPTDERSPGDPPVVHVHEAFTVEQVSAAEVEVDPQYGTWVLEPTPMVQAPTS